MKNTDTPNVPIEKKTMEAHSRRPPAIKRYKRTPLEKGVYLMEQSMNSDLSVATFDCQGIVQYVEIDSGT